MERNKISAWIAYRKEALRGKFFRKRAGYLLLVNVALIILIGALIAFLLERGHNPDITCYWDALYMTFITIATVGYGDVVPVTNGGRVTMILTIVFGIGTLSAFITLLATRRAQRTRRRYSGLYEKTKSKDHVVVCGWNPRGKYVLNRLKEELEEERVEIILLCELEESPVDDDYVFFIRGDPVHKGDLKRVNVGAARTVILLADESKGGVGGDIDARTVLSALIVREIKPDMKMTAEVLEPENIHHLELAGVGEILDTNSFLGNLIARSALNYGMISTFSELITREAGMHTYIIPASGEMVGKTRGEMETELQEKYGSQLVAISAGRDLKPSDKNYRIKEDDNLLVISEEKPPGTMG